jgi:hypothetical protein
LHFGAASVKEREAATPFSVVRRKETAALLLEAAS